MLMIILEEQGAKLFKEREILFYFRGDLHSFLNKFHFSDAILSLKKI